MSCEESYLAIIRYLTDEKEPYAPGTPGNTKRKIRKAAICYVVRNGTLYYQRRLKGQNDFNELEVVLQDARRKELINQAHITEAGEHLNQQLTWETISQKYWWRGTIVSLFIVFIIHYNRQDFKKLTQWRKRKPLTNISVLQSVKAVISAICLHLVVTIWY